MVRPSPTVRLALLWHMHQPYYLDPMTGESILPWVRLHALKDYWGMVALLDEFPDVPVTFNLVPALMEQVEAYAAERTWDRHLVLGLSEATQLSSSDAAWLVREGFHAHAPTMIHPYPRYAELASMRASGAGFGPGELRDLQVWQKLAWVDPDVLAADPRATRLVGKGRDFDEHDKAALRALELDVLRRILPAYRKAAESGRVELSTSPYFHPILPLLCDSAAHHAAHPGAALPQPSFRWPGDARLQLSRAVDAHTRWFGARPRGVWPSEGSVSDAAARCVAEAGFQWMATDEDILARSVTGGGGDAPDLYRPYALHTAGGEVRVLFRDHALSDLVGFTYQGWEAPVAAGDFLARVRHAGRSGTRAESTGVPVVTVILDGENAWEHYAGGGRPFLRALYGALAKADDVEVLPMWKAAKGEARPLSSIFSGSWINADFGIWIGHADDRRAWQQLGAAREVLEATQNVPPESRALAWTAVLAAEGSDWFWWYGDDHSSAHDREFDELFRHHLRRCYEALRRPVPEELYRSNISTSGPPLAAGLQPGGVEPRPEGSSHSYFGQLGAVPLDTGAAGAMHRVDAPAADCRVGFTSDGLALWLDGPNDALTWRLEVWRPGAPDRRLASAPVRSMVLLTWSALGVHPGERLTLQLAGLNTAGQVVGTVPAGGSGRTFVVPSDPAQRAWTV